MRIAMTMLLKLIRPLVILAELWMHYLEV